MNILVTGGAGFIGSHVAKKLVQQGHTVRILDNLSTGNLDNLSGTDIEFLKGDICDLQAVKQAVKDIDVIIHCAAMVSVEISAKDPSLTRRINIEGTRSLLESASHIRKFIFCSSAAVYGEPDELPIKESAKTRPISPYAETKLAAEELCLKSDVNTVILRYFNVFGPRQNPESGYPGVITKFIRCSIENKQPVVFGDGEQTRDFIYVEDVALATIQAIKYENSGKIFNIATGKGVSLLQILDMIEKITGYKFRPQFEDKKESDIRNSLADITHAKDELGFAPGFGLEEGLKKTIGWYEDEN